MRGFSFQDIPSQMGRTALVTGANTGIGYFIAEHLARAGARVLLGCRNEGRGNAAREKIIDAIPGADIHVVSLDLASLDSIRAAARSISKLDLLINNAGILWADHELGTGGVERHMAVNHLGHFALTIQLLDVLDKGQDPRVVTQSSIAHKRVKIDFHNLSGQRDYKRQEFYGRSKLANLLFALELHRRLQAMGSPIASLACHPGVAQTEIARNASWAKPFMPLVGRVLNSAEQGALPALQAATDPNAVSGEYYGPYGLAELSSSRSGRAIATPTARDPLLAARLWDKSAELTGIHPKLAPAT